MVFKDTRGAELHEVGLCFLGISAGMLMGGHDGASVAAVLPATDACQERGSRWRPATEQRRAGVSSSASILGVVLIPIGLFTFWMDHG